MYQFLFSNGITFVLISSSTSVSWRFFRIGFESFLVNMTRFLLPVISVAIVAVSLLSVAASILVAFVVVSAVVFIVALIVMLNRSLSTGLASLSMAAVSIVGWALILVPVGLPSLFRIVLLVAVFFVAPSAGVPFLVVTTAAMILSTMSRRDLVLVPLVLMVPVMAGDIAASFETVVVLVLWRPGLLASERRVSRLAVLALRRDLVSGRLFFSEVLAG